MSVAIADRTPEPVSVGGGTDTVSFEEAFDLEAREAFGDLGPAGEPAGEPAGSDRSGDRGGNRRGPDRRSGGDRRRRSR